MAACSRLAHTYAIHYSELINRSSYALNWVHRTINTLCADLRYAPINYEAIYPFSNTLHRQLIGNIRKKITVHSPSLVQAKPVIVCVFKWCAIEPKVTVQQWSL